MIDDFEQRKADSFYNEHGPCCSGCDHWSPLRGAEAGECLKSQLMERRIAIQNIGINSASDELNKGVSHAITKKDYLCSNFVDTYDWGEHAKR